MRNQRQKTIKDIIRKDCKNIVERLKRLTRKQKIEINL